MRRKYSLKNADKLGWGFSCQDRLQLANAVMAKIRGYKILDVGCGSGWLVDYLSKHGFQATGIDFVREFIEKAKKIHDGSFVLAKAEKLPFKDNSFDTVILANILEHVDRDLTVLKEARRLGRRIIINVPQTTPDNLVKRGLIYKHYLDRTHRRAYDRKALSRRLTDAGLRTIEIREVERLPAMSVFCELFEGNALIKRIVTRVFFWIFPEKNYYLELFTVAESKK